MRVCVLVQERQGNANRQSYSLSVTGWQVEKESEREAVNLFVLFYLLAFRIQAKCKKCGSEKHNV